MATVLGIFKVILEIIVGPMFSGKSEELVRRLVRARYAKLRILVLKPGRDNRSERDIFQLIRENKNLKDYKSITCQTFNSKEDLERLLISYRPEVLAIDEAQFIEEPWIVDVVKILQRLNKDNDYDISGLKIIISGLDMDSNGNEFNQMPTLLAISDRITKMTAICVKCGDDEANMTYRIPGSSQEKILVGGKGTYEVRCRECHKLPD